MSKRAIRSVGVSGGLLSRPFTSADPPTAAGCAPLIVVRRTVGRGIPYAATLRPVRTRLRTGEASGERQPFGALAPRRGATPLGLQVHCVAGYPGWALRADPGLRCATALRLVFGTAWAPAARTATRFCNPAQGWSVGGHNLAVTPPKSPINPNGVVHGLTPNEPSIHSRYDSPSQANNSEPSHAVRDGVRLPPGDFSLCPAPLRRPPSSCRPARHARSLLQHLVAGGQGDRCGHDPLDWQAAASHQLGAH